MSKLVEADKSLKSVRCDTSGASGDLQVTETYYMSMYMYTISGAAPVGGDQGSWWGREG